MTAIELALPPGASSRLFRHKAIAAARAGRTRTEDAGITWHDLADARLAREGLLLSESGGKWRLLRTVRAYGWPAGTETVAEADSAAALDPPVGGHTVALAALVGRRRRVELAATADGGAPLRLSVLEGTLRNVTHELPCCRVLLEGAPEDAARFALLLGDTLPLAPARQSLAELALGFGRGFEAAEPGIPSVPQDADVDGALAGIVGELGATLLRWLPEVEAGVTPRAIHQARVATRRLRSALLVFKPALGGSLDALAPEIKALAGVLGRARDWDVFLAETGAALTAALPGEKRIAALLGEADKRRADAHEAAARAIAQPATRRLLLHLALLPSLRPWRAAPAASGGEASDEAEAARQAMLTAPVRTIAADAVEKRFRRVVRAGKRLEGLEPEALHEVRKSAKKLRYALEFFAPVLPRGETRRLLKLLSTLQDELGALNDTAAGGTLMAAIAPAGGRHDFAAGAVLGWLAGRSAAAWAPLHDTWSAVRRTPRFWRS